MTACLRRALLGLFLGVAALTAQAAEQRSYCVFDPLGAAGPVYNLMKATRIQALNWGYDLELNAYTDEKIAADDFRAGQCDAVLLTDVRARDFNRFTGTLVALGAIPGYGELKTILQTLAQPKAAKLMTSGDFEVAGLLPAGAVYVLVRDRRVNSVQTIQGKKIAAFDYDPAAVTMVRHVGGSVVGATPSSFAGKFNNGSVDVAYAPAIAYQPLELYKGVEPDGGVYSYSFAQMTYQVLVRKDRFKADFAQKAREHFQGRFDELMEMVRKAEAEIPAKVWIHPNQEEATGFNNMLKEVRIALKQDGAYDPKALQLMLKVRCHSDPANAECVDGRE
ncbi:hypothetical protein EUZ85_01480 [Hahella sp. KA22]|uniref:putative solute-binding protein n=1 Tax=Hahella sp. KA22 TaxID=1628392 RepID=UPI000FDDCDF3|nr:putative solute-binding protein [Hahella sp. KA22]AZZ95166.1 hypothetical protein ENC22_29770 [Hahella sp. KA22]QAY52811.1 hypothetical protein EUZ85_01480 [Hahella sp. KA22]